MKKLLFILVILLAAGNAVAQPYVTKFGSKDSVEGVSRTDAKYFSLWMYRNTTNKLLSVGSDGTLRAVPQDSVGSGVWVSLTGSYANPSWITSLAWSKITGTPTTLSGYGITDPIVLTSGSYANPAWITSLIWSKITSTPTTLSGYGITDAVNTSSVSNGSIEKSRTKPSSATTQDAVDRLVALRANTRIGSPKFWWMSDSIGVRLTSGKIDSIIDLSGQGNHAWQATTALKADFNSSGGMNNLPYAAFTAAATTSYTTGSISMGSVYDLYVVMRWNNPAGTGAVLGTSSTNYLGINSSTPNVILNSNGGATGACAVRWDNYGILKISRKDSLVRYWLNGAEVISTNTNLATQSLTISGLFNFVGQHADANVHEIIGYSGDRSDEAKLNTENYLYGKYGVKRGRLIVIGDSWTAGSLSVGQRWATMLANYLGYGEVNQGIAGTVFTSIASPATNCGYCRMARLPYLEPNDVIVIMYGLNDARNPDPTSYNPRLLKQQLGTFTSYLLNNRNARHSQIFLANQSLTNLTATYTQARHDSIANYIMNTADEMNVGKIDVNTLLGSRVQNPPSGGDGVHPVFVQCDTIAIHSRYRIQSRWTKGTVNTISTSYHVPVPNALPYVVTTACTMPLPPVTDNAGANIEISNQSAGNVTVTSYTGSQVFVAGAAAASYDIPAGKTAVLSCRNNLWVVKLFD